MPSTRTKLVRQKSIKYQGPFVWNKLPSEIKKSPSVHTFKNTLKQYLLYLLNIHYISHISIISWLSLLLFAFVLWFLLIYYVSVLAHFLTVIIVCWGG